MIQLNDEKKVNFKADLGKSQQMKPSGSLVTRLWYYQSGRFKLTIVKPFQSMQTKRDLSEKGRD